MDFRKLYAMKWTPVWVMIFVTIIVVIYELIRDTIIEKITGKKSDVEKVYKPVNKEKIHDEDRLRKS